MKVLNLTLHWFFQTQVTSAAGQVAVSRECAAKIYSSCREVCYNIISGLDVCIGGEGLHVEIDESHVFHNKYSRGRILVNQHVWIFGGICRETREMFVEVVPDRRGETLRPIIQRRVHPGTIIITDQARVYDNLHQANRGGFEHYQVNHSEHFVDPDNPNVHTNQIERQWGLKKGKLKGRIEEKQLDMYLGEYQYRKRYLDATTDRERRYQGEKFLVFLNHVKEMYFGSVDN